MITEQEMKNTLGFRSSHINLTTVFFYNHLWYSFIIIFNIENIMKTLKCDLCKVTAKGETFEEWMKALLPHYQKDHSEVMNDPRKTKKDMEKWMVENKARFEAV